jgi:hypothetical protein
VRRDPGSCAGGATCGVGVCAGLVRDGVDAHLGEALLEVRVPVVLDLVVRALGQVRRDRRPPGDGRRNIQLQDVHTGVVFYLGFLLLRDGSRENVRK